MSTSDLVGKESGRQRTYVRDQYVHTVLKVQEEEKPMWVDKALAEACREGYTLVYDEFTRSRPEANNLLLSVLQERVLPQRGTHIPVHPDFRAIFTSNPADYAGVHAVQDALVDRMVTVNLQGLDRDTEVAIAKTNSGLSQPEVERIVDLSRAFRSAWIKTLVASVRPCIMIARILSVRAGHADAKDPIFLQTCRDVLLSEARRTGLDPSQDQPMEESLVALMQQVCSSPLPPEPAPVKPQIWAESPLLLPGFHTQVDKP
jgi:gas vesicle protein GvpN